MPEFVQQLRPLDLCLRGHSRIVGNLSERGCILCKKELAKKRHKRDPRQHLLNNAHTRSKAMGIPSNLTLEDLVIPKFCPILGIELEVGGKDSSPSIDRIFPQLGYVKGNVQIISMRANRIKADSTPDELKKVADYMQRITCQNS